MGTNEFMTDRLNVRLAVWQWANLFSEQRFTYFICQQETSNPRENESFSLVL